MARPPSESAGLSAERKVALLRIGAWLLALGLALAAASLA